MIVIEGKSEKSKHIVNMVMKEFMTDNILIIDTVGATSVFSELNIRYLSLFNKNVIKEFENHYESFKDFDWIILYVNVAKDELESFKRLDRRYPQNFIVTVQNNDKGLTDKYYL